MVFFMFRDVKQLLCPFSFFKPMLLLFSISNLLSSLIFFPTFLPIRKLYGFLLLSFHFFFHFYVYSYVLVCSVSLKTIFIAFYRSFNYKFILLVDAKKALKDFFSCEVGFFSLRPFNLPLSSDFCALHFLPWQQEVAKCPEFWSINSNLFLPYKESSMHIFM